MRLKSVPPAEPVQPTENADQPADVPVVEPKPEEQPHAEETPKTNQEDESNMWEETFKSHTDSKPNGSYFFH
jgi:hypothetical protein